MRRLREQSLALSRNIRLRHVTASILSRLSVSAFSISPPIFLPIFPNYPSLTQRPKPKEESDEQAT